MANVLVFGATSDAVKQLQRDLTTIGIPLKDDGGFGNLTKRGVELFQWNAQNFSRRRKGDHLIKAPLIPFTVNFGAADEMTLRALAKWIASDHKVTGSLFRFDVSQLSNVNLRAGYSVVGSASSSECVLTWAVCVDLYHANKAARELGVKIQLNQTFRSADVDVRGAVVKPAQKSQHLIGYAWDCNIWDGKDPNLQRTFKAGKETENATKFIKAMKERGMRWGGDFRNSRGAKIWDSPHFDRQINASGEGYTYLYYFNQQVIRENHTMPTVRT